MQEKAHHSKYGRLPSVSGFHFLLILTPKSRMAQPSVLESLLSSPLKTRAEPAHTQQSGLKCAIVAWELSDESRLTTRFRSVEALERYSRRPSMAGCKKDILYDSVLLGGAWESITCRRHLERTHHVSSCKKTHKLTYSILEASRIAEPHS